MRIARRSVAGLVHALVLFLLLAAVPAAAQDGDAALMAAFPAADRIGPAQGRPPVHPAYRDGKLIGHAFYTRDVSGAAGYMARPLNLAIGLGLDGVIAGVRIIEHHEPILMIGVADKDLAAFVQRYVGLDIADRVQVRPLARKGERAFDAISGATISSLALHDAIVGSARIVARSLDVKKTATGGIDLDSFSPESWPELLAAGSVVQREITLGDVDRLLRADGVTQPVLPGAPANANFITLFAALATPPQIGRNLLGENAYNRLMSENAAGTQLLFVAAHGAYSFKGTNFARTGFFDRIQLIQDDKTLQLTDEMHRRIERLAVRNGPELREIAIFVLPPDGGFAAAKPWRLDLLVAGRRANRTDALATFALPYVLPPRHVARPTAPPPADVNAPGERHEALWMEVWEARLPRLIVLGAALFTLYLILAFQGSIARRPRLWNVIRIVFPLFTLFWLGWYAGGQLSVVNVLTFGGALRTNSFEWDFFLLEPLIFVLWSWVAVAMLFWGRGVFCGWLCPFGALQELANRGARLLKLPQFRVPFILHERLWPAKYILFLGLFAVSLGSMEWATFGAEVEPFKTAISLHFLRDGMFVGYALLLIAAGLFVERFFCRYVCPLGASLAIPARLRMFDWHERRRQCGTECQICASRCPVQAIHPDGQINPNECIDCLRCQTFYYDDSVCPPLIARRRRREERAAFLKSPSPEKEAAS